MTLAVERHNGRLWVCLVDGTMTVLLAQFGSRTQAEQFKAALVRMQAAAHAAGASGI